MRIVVVGAGSVGRSITRELLSNEHSLLVIDKYAREERVKAIGIWSGTLVVGATGDDKVNLVVSLLAKTEFGVPRTVARVNNPRNEWMFDEGWGVDVAVSTPRLMTALVEEAVSVGDLVRLFEFQQGKATMVELTLPLDSPYCGSSVADLALPPECVLVGIIRDQLPMAPVPEESLQALDELLFLATRDAERTLAAKLTGRRRDEVQTVLSDRNF